MRHENHSKVAPTHHNRRKQTQTTKTQHSQKQIDKYMNK